MENKNKIYKIYCHINKINGKIYIGQTCYKNANYRWRDGEGYKHSPYFYNAIQKYGWDNFEHIILFDNIIGFEMTDIIESELIKKFKTNYFQYGYNLSSGGSFGRTLSIETKNKIRKSKIGNKNPNYGKKASEKTRQRLSAAHKGIKQTQEWVNARIRSGDKNGMYGKKLSSESRKKISDSIKGGKNHSAKQCFLFSNLTDITIFECLTYAYLFTNKGTSYCRHHRLNGIYSLDNNEIFYILTTNEYAKFLIYCKENDLPINTIQQRYDAYNKFYNVKVSYIDN